QSITGVGLHHLHPDEEAVEGAEASHAGADGYRRWFSPRDPSAVTPGEHVSACHFIRCLVSPAKEVPQHARVALHGPQRTGAPLLLGQEGIERTLPACGGRLIQIGDIAGQVVTPSLAMCHDTAIAIRVKSTRIWHLRTR